MSTVKLIPKEDIKDFVNIARNAYPSMKVNSQEEIEKATERFSKMQEERKKINFYGLYRDDKMLGGMLHYDFIMNFSSQRIDAGGVGFVAVEFLHKKEKVAKDLITFYLNHYKERGTYMAVLYPFRPDFYKKMGFGYGTKMNQYKIEPRYLPKGSSKSNVFFIGEEDKEELLACYRRHMMKTHGMMEKSEQEVSNLFKNPQNRVVAYKKDNKILAYMAFSFKVDEKESFLITDINVNEFIYEDQNALLEIMTFLHSQSDQIRYIIVNTQDEYFHHMLSNPTNGTNNIIPSVYHESNIQGVGIMYRVIDIKGIFSTLEEHSFGNENCKLKLSIQDSFIQDNDRSFIIHFNEGRAEMKDDNDFEVEISMDIAEFSSLLVGSVNFKSLYRYGLANISDTSYIDTVNKLFYIEEKPICTTPF